MDHSQIESQILGDLVKASFAHPESFQMLVERTIVRNRSLSSRQRRELSDHAYQAIRWRRRVWGDIEPSAFDEKRFFESLSETQNIIKQPPLAKWASLSMDALARELSYPTWLVSKWVSQRGLEGTIHLALAMNEGACLTLRTNTLKVERPGLLASLKNEGLEPVAGKLTPWSISLSQRRNVRGVSVYRKGWFEIQDEGSQVAAWLTQAQPGELVMDACTRTGGKALAMAAMMKNKGRIIAVDSDARPLEELKKRCKRAGVRIVEPYWIAKDDPQPLTAFVGKVDRVLVDAPCSAVGTLKRRPWLRWTLHPSQIDMLAKQQQALLKRFSRWVKPGGHLTYVTCTLLMEENDRVVQQFLNEEDAFFVNKPPHHLVPFEHGCDGFYIAQFQRGQNL